MSRTSHPFDALTPDLLLDAVESTGLLSDGRVSALNSYENRVFQVGIEDDAPLIAKFYRPERWSTAQIQEEHAFSQALSEAELSVVAPLVRGGRSLFSFSGFRFALYPRRGGHAPELDNPDTLYRLGRTLGRIHNIGAIEPFRHRPTLTLDTFGRQPAQWLLDHAVPEELKAEYRALTETLLQLIEAAFADTAPTLIRVHGDCHVGNVLWRDNTAHFIDLDDARMAPAIQDLWLLLSGDATDQRRQMSEVLDGYEEFRDFDRRELALVEPLRTLRMIHFAAWIGQRWDDPAFPRAFPWFNSPHYWPEHLAALAGQQQALTQPAWQIH